MVQYLWNFNRAFLHHKYFSHLLVLLLLLGLPSTYKHDKRNDINKRFYYDTSKTSHKTFLSLSFCPHYKYYSYLYKIKMTFLLNYIGFAFLVGHWLGQMANLNYPFIRLLTQMIFFVQWNIFKKFFFFFFKFCFSGRLPRIGGQWWPPYSTKAAIMFFLMMGYFWGRLLQ